MEIINLIVIIAFSFLPNFCAATSINLEKVLHGDLKENIRVIVCHFPVPFMDKANTIPSALYEGGPSVNLSIPNGLMNAMVLNNSLVRITCIHNCPSSLRRSTAQSRGMWQSEANAQSAADCLSVSGPNESTLAVAESNSKHISMAQRVDDPQVSPLKNHHLHNGVDTNRNNSQPESGSPSGLNGNAWNEIVPGQYGNRANLTVAPNREDDNNAGIPDDEDHGGNKVHPANNNELTSSGRGENNGVSLKQNENIVKSGLGTPSEGYENQNNNKLEAAEKGVVSGENVGSQLSSGSGDLNVESTDNENLPQLDSNFQHILQKDPGIQHVLEKSDNPAIEILRQMAFGR